MCSSTCRSARFKNPVRHSENPWVDDNARWSGRLTNSSVLLTVMMVTALSAAALAQIVATTTAAPGETRNAAVDAKAYESLAYGSHQKPVMAAPTAPTTTSTTTSPTLVAPPSVAPARAPAPATAPATAPVPASAVSGGYGCASALTYLQSHAAPGFMLECPGWADGHQAMTCDNVAGVCPGAKVIAISVPCAAAYMNEASNSWVIIGESNAAIDPYGYCH